MMRLRSLISVFFLSATTFAPQIAYAQFGLSSSSNSNGNGAISVATYPYFMPVSDPRSDSHAGFVGPISSSVSSYAGELYEEGDGSASGTANYGSLQATANGGGEGGSGSGDNTSRWFDTVTITSTTLPLGSPVTLLATASYSGQLTGTTYQGYAGSAINPGAEGQATVTFKSDIGSSSLPYTTNVDVLFMGYPGNDGGFTINQTLQQKVATYVGATLPLDSEIDLSASGFGSGFKVSGFGSGNVSSVFDVQSQTMGVTLIRASSAVPAPSALVTVLLGAGMFGLTSRLRRPFTFRG